MTKRKTNPKPRGGKRKGAGRKPAPYGATKMIRVPLGILPTVLQIIRRFKGSKTKNLH